MNVVIVVELIVAVYVLGQRVGSRAASEKESVKSANAGPGEGY